MAPSGCGTWWRYDARTRPAIQKGTRVLISLWDSLMFGRVPGTRPNISESHSEISTLVPVCIPTRHLSPRGGPSFSLFRTRITTCYPDRAATGPHFVPGLPHAVAHSRRPRFTRPPPWVSLSRRARWTTVRVQPYTFTIASCFQA